MIAEGDIVLNHRPHQLGECQFLVCHNLMFLKLITYTKVNIKVDFCKDFMLNFIFMHIFL